MGKYTSKTQAALKARQKAYDAVPAGNTKAAMRKPGSQNRKKGYGRGSSRR